MLPLNYIMNYIAIKQWLLRVFLGFTRDGHRSRPEPNSTPELFKLATLGLWSLSPPATPPPQKPQAYPSLSLGVRCFLVASAPPSVSMSQCAFITSRKHRHVAGDSQSYPEVSPPPICLPHFLVIWAQHWPYPEMIRLCHFQATRPLDASHPVWSREFSLRSTLLRNQTPNSSFAVCAHPHFLYFIMIKSKVLRHDCIKPDSTDQIRLY